MIRAAGLAVLGVALALSAAAEPVTTLQSTGSSANRVDLVVMGDGYTAAEIASGKYAADAAQVVNQFFLTLPFNEYRGYFNVHRVDVTSLESGADHPSRSILKNTALDASYDCGGITRLICVSSSKVSTVLTASLPSPASRDLTLVIVNDPEYGGSGATALAVLSLHASAVEIALHEMGHSFGLLADEYGGPPPPSCVNTIEPSEANATLFTSRAALKWLAWVDPLTPTPTTSTANGIPGAYTGAKYCDAGLYRPTYNSKMRALGQPFHQINTEQLVKRVYNFVSPIDSVTPAAGVVRAGSGSLFQVTTPLPATHPLTVQWLLDGRVVGTTRTLNLPAVVGSHTLQVVVSDQTSLVRQAPANLMTATRTWTILGNVGAGDFDGDGRADFALFRPSTGVWWTLTAQGAITSAQWGTATDVPVPGDYDGDGRSDVAVYRPSNGTWYILLSSGGWTGTQFGASTDRPVPADYDGDGRTDIAVYRPSDGTWYLLQSTAGFAARVWGATTDVPMPADFDGDGRADLALFRPGNGTWYVLYANNSWSAVQWGAATDRLVPADYDGDGRTDYAVYRPTNGTWYILGSTAGFQAAAWGSGSDIPVPGDFDGDGRTDVAIFRPSTGVWWVLGSSSGPGAGVTWGAATDLPILQR